MNQTDNKKEMEFLYTLIIILIMIVFVAILAYLIQAGQCDRIGTTGRKVVDPPSYHVVPANCVTPLGIFVAVPAGMQTVAEIANMILITGGSFAVIETTGVIKVALAKALKMGGRLGVALLPVVIVTFSLLSASTGSTESMLIFVPLGILFAWALSFNAMVGLFITIVAGNAGSASGLLNTMTTGVAQILFGIEPPFGL